MATEKGCSVRGEQHDARNILIVKFRNIGDVLLVSSMAFALAQRPDKPRVTVLVKAGTEAMLTGHPDIHEVLTLPKRQRNESLWAFLARQVQFIGYLRGRRFDLSINTTEGDRGIISGFLSGARQRTGYLKPRDQWWRKAMITRALLWQCERRHTVLRNLDLIEHLITCGPIHVGFYFSSSDKNHVYTILKERGWDERQQLVHIHPISRWFFKCWRDEYMAETIDVIQRVYRARVVITCAPDPKEKARLNAILCHCQTHPIDLGGQLTLKQTGALSALAQLFVGVDSAPMHMAAAVGTRSVAIFGPSGGFEWGPWPNGWNSANNPYQQKNGVQKTCHIIVQKPWACVPCGQDGCSGSKRSDCLEQLTPQEVLPHIHSSLQNVRVTTHSPVNLSQQRPLNGN